MNVSIATVILTVSTAYAVLRYAVFGPVDLIHAPSYLFNKSVAVATVAFLCLLTWAKCCRNSARVQFWGRASLHSGFVHVVLSCVLLSPSYYPKFFGPHKLNLLGELTMLSGALTAYCFWILSRGAEQSERRRFWYAQVALWCVSGHLLAMGFKGWLTVGKWHGGLPPISLLGFLFVVIAYVLLLKSRMPAVVKEDSTSIQSQHAEHGALPEMAQPIGSK